MSLLSLCVLQTIIMLNYLYVCAVIQCLSNWAVSLGEGARSISLRTLPWRPSKRARCPVHYRYSGHAYLTCDGSKLGLRASHFLGGADTQVGCWLGAPGLGLGHSLQLLVVVDLEGGWHSVGGRIYTWSQDSCLVCLFHPTDTSGASTRTLPGTEWLWR